MRYKNVLLVLVVIFLIFGGVFFTINNNPSKSLVDNTIPFISPTISLSPTPTPYVLPDKKLIENDYQIFQSFNNCGPASLSMALSYYGISQSQETLGQLLRPYQVAGGDNDDKSVTLAELASTAASFNLVAYHRPNGNIHILKQFLAQNIPVITRTLLTDHDDIGHFRVIKGYDDVTSEIIQDDSYQGHNVHYSYNEFDMLWSKYNYEYVVMLPKDKVALAEQILGEDADQAASWKKAVELSLSKLAQDPDDYTAQFNLSVAYYNIQEYQKSVEAFEKVAPHLTLRTLWYQIEPIEAYYNLQMYDKVFAITDSILNNQNRAFSELYILRGNSYKNQGKREEAKSEFEKALYYNKNLKAAQEAMQSL